MNLLNRKLLLTIIILTFIILVLTPQIYVNSYTEKDVSSKLYNVYSKIVNIYKSGGNVSKAVNMLNNAINDISMYKSTNDTKYLSDAMNILNNVEKMLPKILEEGKSRVFWGNVYMGTSIALIIAFAILGYLYIPRTFFKTWARLRGRNKVIIRKERSKKKSMIIDQEVWAVILAIILVGSIFAFTQAYMSGKVIEPFSELGLLGKNKKIGDYPRNLVVGDNATFYVYVGNHMGQPMFYIVYVKLGDNSTAIDPAPIKPILTFERILMNNETWLFKVNLPIKKAGLNQRIIVELWIYNTTINSIQYHHRWTQLWINVTST